MPRKYSLREHASEAYYHIFNRGVNKNNIFSDASDYAVFLNLLKRYLSDTPEKDKKFREYPNYNNDLELLAFCLMPNHFHLLIYQTTPGVFTKLLSSVGTSYTMYCNKKYHRVGHLFQNRFQASMITDDAYLQHISRYIHLNPAEYKQWEWSSLPYYLGQKQSSWIKPAKILGVFGDDQQSYENFLDDYDNYQKTLEQIEGQLAS